MLNPTLYQDDVAGLALVALIGFAVLGLFIVGGILLWVLL